jgi:hypothetical protein
MRPTLGRLEQRLHRTRPWTNLPTTCFERMVVGKVKSLEQTNLGPVVAKRLSKALRGKRRWVGVEVNASILTREDLEAHLTHLKQTHQWQALRLMDFQNAERRRTGEGEQDRVKVSEKTGVAILQVSLQDYPGLRQALEAANATETHGLRSLTSSGKIRLVRQRLGLPKPPRR